MAWGRRCDLGCESWPDDKEYDPCPVCGQEAKRFSNLRPLEDDEARKQKARIDFEAYYEKYCEERNQGVEGPLSPEVEEALTCTS